MGAPKSDSQGLVNERPQHKVKLDAYYIDIYDVTNSLYAACVKAGACTPPHVTRSNTRISYYGNSMYNDYPVVYVDWEQAKFYCGWRGGRLPTEAEWEKAARGGLEGKLYPWGDEPPDCSRVNFNGGACVGDTSKVGDYPPNGYGLYDMEGNVWNWVWDWYAEAFYANSPFEIPQGPDTGQYHVLRGSCWGNVGWNIRITDRNKATPSYEDVYTGFRCAHLP